MDEILHARVMLPTFATWGEARCDLLPEYFDDLIDSLLGPGDRPLDDESLDADELIEAGDWPGLHYGEIVGWLPEEAVDRFGEPWSGFCDSGTHLPADHEDDLIEFLGASGITCQADTRVLDLFCEVS